MTLKSVELMKPMLVKDNERSLLEAIRHMVDMGFTHGKFMLELVDGEIKFIERVPDNIYPKMKVN